MTDLKVNMKVLLFKSYGKQTAVVSNGRCDPIQAKHILNI